MVPRACKFCGYYGHTRQFCKRRMARDRQAEAKEYERLKREEYVPLTEDQCTPEHWKWIVGCRAYCGKMWELALSGADDETYEREIAPFREAWIGASGCA